MATILTHDTEIAAFDGLARTLITVPAGSAVHKVDGRYVVSSVALLIRLTGNDHDPKYRYVWLPEGAEVSHV
jgi:formylmethanofuran dehydrogenase subunit E-like metal-binding protein